jgi:hypothetical protein
MNQNIKILQMFQERSVHKLKVFRRKKWTIHVHVPKFLELVQVMGLERLEDFTKHMPKWITVYHFIEWIPSSPQANPYKTCIVCNLKMGKRKIKVY